MRQAAIRIYESLFPGCYLQDLREHGAGVHVLDKEFAIDSLLVIPQGYWFSLQEKYRQNKYLVNPRLQISPPYPDFTQEFRNAVGTPHESQGEWFKLAAQLYFYGWSNRDETDFERWVILDVAKYKLIVQEAGGFDGLPHWESTTTIGRLLINTGRNCANFYAIPICRLKEAIVFQS